MEDWKSRTRMLVGQNGLDRLEQASVVVAGIGGVGAYAAEMLVRAGVGHISIIDSDEVSVTNRNRQLIALDSTVGRPKCEVMEARLMDINPGLDLKLLQTYILPSVKSDGSPCNEGSGSVPEALLAGMHIDFVVDAIDTLAPKLSLIKYCVEAGIPIVSSMGAGAKYDVTKVRIADISKSFNCPLAYIVRKRLRHMGISKGVQTVFSEELSDRNAFVPCDEPNKKSQVGTVSYLPAVFGCACAQAVLQHLLGMK